MDVDTEISVSRLNENGVPFYFACLSDFLLPAWSYALWTHLICSTYFPLSTYLFHFPTRVSLPILIHFPYTYVLLLSLPSPFTWLIFYPPPTTTIRTHVHLPHYCILHLFHSTLLFPSPHSSFTPTHPFLPIHLFPCHPPTHSHKQSLFLGPVIFTSGSSLLGTLNSSRAFFFFFIYSLISPHIPFYNH